MSASHDPERCPACGAVLDALRTKTDAERTHAVAEELRARGADLTDAAVNAQLNKAARVLGA